MAAQLLSALFTQQTEVSKLISDTLPNLKKRPAEQWTKQRILGRLNILKDHWLSFRASHAKIMQIREKATKDVLEQLKATDYFRKDEYALCQEEYLEALENLELFLDKIVADSVKSGESLANASLTENQRAGATFSHRLPKLDIPKFDGHFLNWIPFRDLFVSLVGSSTVLSNVEKLHYLKMSLVGHAAERIQSVPMIGDHFAKVWDHLLHYYNNTRILVQSTVREMLNIPPIKRESYTEIEQLLSTFIRLLQTLEALGRRADHLDDFVVQLALSKLDPPTVKDWETSLGSSTTPPTWDQLQEFLISRIRSLEAFSIALPQNSSASTHQSKPRSNRSLSYHVAHGQVNIHRSNRSASANADAPQSGYSAQCVLCSANHVLASCPNYKAKTPQQRRDVVVQKSLCFNCLGAHRVSDCQNSKRCQQCGHPHHTSIHSARSAIAQSSASNSSGTPLAPAASALASVNHVVQHLPDQRKPVLLATARVQIYSEHGEVLPARLLLDQGSEISFVSERLAQRLRLSRHHASIPLVGIGAHQSCVSNGSVSLRIKPHFASSIELKVIAYVLPKLTAELPSIKTPATAWSHFGNLVLADPSFSVPGAVDVILGADVYGQIIEAGIVKGQVNEPIAQRSILGWIISGPVGSEGTPQAAQGYHCSIDHELHELLQRFWLQEELPASNKAKIQSPDEEECEQHFISTHTRTDSGRYVVRLPTITTADNLGDSRTPALRMLARIQRRLDSDPKFSSAYTNFMSEYESLGHMKRVSVNTQEPSRVFYLPHHGVIRESSSTTNLRVVFNGSSRTNNGISINDILHTGEKLQTNLADVLLRFRRHLYVFATDMEKMYRQVNVHKDDWDLQRILWADSDHVINTYHLTTVTYGMGCAPFLALRSMLQLITDDGPKFPLAISTLLRGRYVDDIFGGADTIESTQEIMQQVINLCMAGGFTLRKWISNEPAVLTDLPLEQHANTSALHIDELPVNRTLGLLWQPPSDRFRFAAQQSTSTTITKRAVLSQVAQVFDPLGFLSPILIKAKIFLQELWLLKLEWDELLSITMTQKWLAFRQQLDDISLISIPRWLGTSSAALALELHGFSDASQLAMAAVVYIRILTDIHEATVNLVCAKTKVAPLKAMTIPRLELSAAAILAKLIAHVQQVLELESVPIHLWTDSSVTLTWVTSHPSRWKDFIRNRVCSIQETLPSARWHFVPGQDNPADCASRGLTPSQLSQHPLWWNGPSWLARHSSTWPVNSQLLNKDFDLEERSVQASVAVKIKPENWDLLSRISNLTRLLRLTATVRRVISRFRRVPKSSIAYPLTSSDLHEAKLFWVKTIQQYEFAQELKWIGAGSTLPRSNSLSRLTPFIDQHGLLRVGGRLHNSNLHRDAKHPLILPRNSHFTTLVIDSAHAKTLHGGTQATLSLLRETFWVIGGRAPIRSFILRCIKCARFRGTRAQQLMGQLPASRATPARPFQHTGVDYARPFVLKTWRGRAAKTYKGYIALFVCFSTSALHLELVTDYTTEAFLAAFKRFTSRRGVCSFLYSDCGTNFLGANKELKRLFNQVSREATEVSQLLANDGTTWVFNPPAAPHFGGKWEAGVKSVKYHLSRVIGETLLTYEEFTTLLTQIEAVLNSRPLCPLSDDSRDFDALTPGHFLIGTALTSIPEPSFLDLTKSHLSRWQHLQQLTQQFWKRWSMDVLQRFHSTSKWLHPTNSIQEGSLVLITDERYPPSKWPLGRIIKLHAGADGLTRVVTLKTQTSTLQRPISKLCLLPVSTASSSSTDMH